MHPLAGRAITRMNGAGNEILVLDLRGTQAHVRPADARAIHAAPRLSYDQLMVLENPRRPGEQAFMTIFNNDGSLSAACGNGTRCVAYFLARAGAGDEVWLETSAGPLTVRRRGEFSFTVDMGVPRLDWRAIPLAHAADPRALAIAAAQGAGLPPAFCVSMGNPHAIFFVKDIEAFDLAALGPRLEHDPIFPERANISLAQVAGADQVRLKVWERGAGMTRACGSAACATLVAAANLGLTGRKATISQKGGDLVIEQRGGDDHILMTGPVEMEFETVLDAAIFAAAAAS